jgi:hypothetical protein
MNAGQDGFHDESSKQMSGLMEGHRGMRNVSHRGSIDHTICSSCSVQMAFLAYLEPGSLTNPRYLVWRLQRRLLQATIVVGFWTLTAQEVVDRDALAVTRADSVVTSLR